MCMNIFKVDRNLMLYVHLFQFERKHRFSDVRCSAPKSRGYEVIERNLKAHRLT